MEQSSIAAVILAGGRSSRMPGDKLALMIDGRTLLERAVVAAAAVADPVIVAGPRPGWWTDEQQVSFVVESPPFGGPVAGIAAALPLAAAADEVLVLAGDLADPGWVVAQLMAAPLTADGVVMEDGEGRAQPMAGRYRPARLAATIAHLGAPRNVSVAVLGHSLELGRVAAPDGSPLEITTPDDAHRVRAIMPGRGTVSLG